MDSAARPATTAHVAVVLAGCGHRDGAEVREAAYTLLALDQAGATFQCYAPDKPQYDVVDHRTGKVVPDATRNVLVESARIARGDVRPLDTYRAADFDALVFPGGTGAAKNLSDFALQGADATVDPDVRAAVEATRAANKPLGFVCITPACVGALLLGQDGVALTIGSSDDPTASILERLGATHIACAASHAVVDAEHRVVSTPAYMDADARPGAVYDGIRELVDGVLALIRRSE